MSDTKCRCNHHEVTHRFGNCLGMYAGGDRCDCTGYEPMTAEQQRAVHAIEEMMRGERVRLEFVTAARGVHHNPVVSNAAVPAR